MTMSVWEQRTSQLRKHHQMSSREILFNSPSEEKDGPPSAHGQLGHPLSLHRKVLEHTPSGSLKGLKDPLASPVKNQAPVCATSVDISVCDAVSSDLPLSPDDALMPESLGATNETLPEASLTVESLTEGGTLSVVRSPRLNDERQRRAVKKVRPPDNLQTTSPEMEGHDGIEGRKASHLCDHQSRARGQGSSTGSGNRPASRSLSGGRKRNPEKIEAMEAEGKREEEVYKPDESR